MDLGKRLEGLRRELEVVEANFHRISGAITLVEHMIAEEKEKGQTDGEQSEGRVD